MRYRTNDVFKEYFVLNEFVSTTYLTQSQRFNTPRMNDYTNLRCGEFITCINVAFLNIVHVTYSSTISKVTNIRYSVHSRKLQEMSCLVSAAQQLFWSYSYKDAGTTIRASIILCSFSELTFSTPLKRKRFSFNMIDWQLNLFIIFQKNFKFHSNHSVSFYPFSFTLSHSRQFSFLPLSLSTYTYNSIYNFSI